MVLNNDIHWWELHDNAILIVDRKGLELLETCRKKRCFSYAIIDSHLRRKYVAYRYEKGTRRPQKGTLSRIIDFIGVQPRRFEKYIVGVTSAALKKDVSIRFPIKENPLHARILAHGLFDGDETSGSLVYGTVSALEQEVYRGIVRKSLGNVHLVYSRNRTALPTSITQLLKNHYDVKSLYSLKGKFSAELMEKALSDKKWGVEILRAAFIDEGCVTAKNGVTALNSKNKKLVKQICKLLDSYGYNYWISEAPTETTVNICSDSVADYYDRVIKDLPDGYYKKKLAKKVVTKAKRTINRKTKREQQYDRIMDFIKKEGEVTASELYREFDVRNKKRFYDKYIRMLINKSFIKIMNKATYKAR